MKLLPFDLAKAQAGHPWGTRDGRKGRKIFDTERSNTSRLISIIEDGFLLTNDVNGNYHNKGESSCDLFLYEEEKIGWVVIYRDFHFGFLSIRCSDEKERLHYEKVHKDNGTYIDTVEVRY